MTETELTNVTPVLVIPAGTALDIADMAESMAEDARRLAKNPSEPSAEDLLTTMRLLYQRLAGAFKKLDMDLPEDAEAIMPISRETGATALAELRQQIIASDDLAGYLAMETQRWRALEAEMIRLAMRVDELVNQS